MDYIYSELLKYGDYYTLSNQSFPAVSGNVFESRLVLGATVPKSAVPMGLTPPTKDKEPVHGDLVLVHGDGCDILDYPAEVKGNIALVERGACSFGTKSELSGQAGAIAAVIGTIALVPTFLIWLRTRFPSALLPSLIDTFDKAEVSFKRAVADGVFTNEEEQNQYDVTLGS